MQKFQEIIDRLTDIEKNRMKIADTLKNVNNSFSIGPNEEIFDKRLINKIQLKPIKKNVVGVDGGIVKTSLHGVDLILFRAIGVNFIYLDNVLHQTNYFPSTFPEPSSEVIVNALSEIELEYCHNFVRQIKEIETAIESIKKFKPEMVLLDGSIIPHYVTKPENDFLKEYYKKLIDIYKELFDLSENIVLAGVIEDSRGNKFCDILIRRAFSIFEDELNKKSLNILEKTRDTNLLYYMLEKGERTCVFNYSSTPSNHPIIKEFSKFFDKFVSFYVKTVEFDRPIRVDFLANDDPIETANEISNFLISTSGHADYGLPAVLIEADKRAKLTHQDLDNFYHDIINKIGNFSSIFKLRRENRPF
ncbi:MAG: DNA double-strand break repair nuclease NurA [Candidatus Aenigmatarchaeota archaeon]|nr:DNA double-strand break repair nuclease NurA [Candidatus Aenigmarchaeota archaeon]